MESITGVIVKVYGLYYTVKYNDKETNCVLRGKIRQEKSLQQYTDPAAVGDEVIFEINNDSNGIIDEILPRRNLFSRKEKGKNRKEDIIAANLDLIVIIQAFEKPKFNLRFVDRLLVRAEKEKIPVILCINKADLKIRETVKYLKNYYADSNITLFMVSALTGTGMNDLIKRLKSKKSLFIGNSGVGKTSILNYIYPDLNLKTNTVSKSTNKGKHTTANVAMITLADGTEIIDTPGVREFGLMDIEPHMLDRYFHEFSKYLEKCSFTQCTHDHEPDCEIKRQVEAGNISGERYISYLNILYSLKEYYERLYQ